MPLRKIWTKKDDQIDWLESIGRDNKTEGDETEDGSERSFCNRDTSSDGDKTAPNRDKSRRSQSRVSRACRHNRDSDQE